MTARLTVATVNDDFTDRVSNLLWVARRSDVLLTQENKRDTVRRLLPVAWGVHQVTTSASTRGSAVAWRQSLVKAAFFDQRIAARGRGILPRRMTIVHGRVVANWTPITLIACHRPLKRTRLQPMFDRTLAVYCTVLRRLGRVTVIGLDANQRNPKRLAHRCGLKWVAPDGSIDGFLVTKTVKVEAVWRLPKGSSDHHPVVAELVIHDPGSN